MITLPADSIYNPDFFNPTDIDDAKRIVLGHGIAETDSKWEVETAWTMLLLKQKQFLNKDSIVLDWGVGIGRLSKAIIETFGCQVVGVDINENMISHAYTYVNSDKFTAMTVTEFVETNTTEFTNAIAVWALQHSIDVDSDLSVIKNRLSTSGKLFIFEEIHPCIPLQNSNAPWFILNKSNFTTIDKEFKIVEHGVFPPHFNILENNNAWWGFFKNK
jgi:cyclopropane fatty-acyl-phospholipid synthase-like methyltransferase